MNLKWRDVSIKNKLFIICLLIIIFMSAAIFGYMMPKVRESLIDTRKGNLEDIVNLTISGIDAIYSEYKNNKISYEEASAKSIDLVRSVRYGPEGKDYLWINDFQPKMIMHPFNKALEGKDMSDYKDSKGKPFFMEFIAVCRKSGSGYVSYMWQWKDNANLIVPKISYVKEYKPFNWIIGTGLYVKDVEAQIALELKQLNRSILAVIGFILVMTLIVIFAFGSNIKKLVGLNISLARKLADCDLTERIPLNQKDEFGILASALNKSAENLEKLISGIIDLSQSLVQAIQEIASGNENLSQRTAEQASSIEEVASTVEESNASITQNAENSKTANEIAKKTTTIAEEGGRVVYEAIEAINEINEASKKIESIISVINEISFQTNLLALNAAVEAARAGEHGRGFAVVAGEVRNLAQRSGSAAKEVGELIKSTTTKVDRGTSLSKKSGESLTEIISSVKNVNRLVSEIDAASAEQRMGAEQINITISELDSMTQQNAGLVEQTASASEQIANQAQELLCMVTKFKLTK